MWVVPVGQFIKLWQTTYAFVIVYIISGKAIIFSTGSGFGRIWIMVSNDRLDHKQVQLSLNPQPDDDPPDCDG